MNKRLIRCFAGAFLVALCIVSCKKDPIPEDLGTSLNPANSFIISSPGTYSFKPVKGQSSQPVGTVADVEVLWETFGTAEKPAVGSIVASADYVYTEDAIRFKTPSTLKDGNALIAAKDASGNILWSWHIWVCNGWDPDKTAHTYYNDAGVIMDRNLGATSTTPGDVKSFGLLYQWGRKDPFLGASSTTEYVEAASTLTWPDPVKSDPKVGNIEYAIAHPTTFICFNSNNWDWYYADEYTTDNTRWGDEKTIYDPCPAGWRIPLGSTYKHPESFWYKACRKHFIFLLPDPNYGVNLTGFFGDADPIWFPFSGFRADDTGKVFSVGKYAAIWTSNNDEDTGDEMAPVMALGLNISPTMTGDFEVMINMDLYRALGFGVRCVKDDAK